MLTALLTRVGRQLTTGRLVRLTGLTTADVGKQAARFAKAGVLSRRTDLDACPAKDYFRLPKGSVTKARTQLQLVDDEVLRELAEERGLDVDTAFGQFPERQPYATALGKALRTVREDLGWSLKDVEKLVPVSTATMSNFETGGRLPTLITLAELARAYGADVVELIVHAACHSQPDKKVQRLRIADPTFRAVLTHLYAAHDQRERARLRVTQPQGVTTQAS
ncbi:helix-turn-helix domain-containing protein [Nocardia sp. NRRL S-836]|uniref:helix-turn-helix domain-containing protein n=1 Tax=Nocardia sp. NRRL S-836 TaxID=1519492 RepID=UPI0018D032B7|nr:helix-turn-helix transcriptional regulator [Nocardia sp. NRRL S-836]